jgi:DNA polymerase-1
MSRLLLIDSNNRCWASYHAYSRLSYKGESVSILYGLPSIVSSTIKKLNADKTIMVWDGKHDSERVKIHPNYKERDKKSLVDYESFMEQKSTVYSMVRFLGIPQALNATMEADDLIYSLVRKNLKKYDEITIVSGDKDFNQLVRPYSKKKGTAAVNIFNDSKKLTLDHKNMETQFGYTPKQTVDYLSLVGDKSDNIPGYPGIGDKRARDLLSKYGSVAGFLKSSDSHNQINKEKLLEVMEINRILIDLRYFHKTFIKGNPKKKIKWINNEENPEKDIKKFKKLCAKYGMKKLMGKSFLNTF